MPRLTETTETTALSKRTVSLTLAYIFGLCVLGIALVQWHAVTDEALDLLNGKVRVNVRQSALYRGADAAYGGEFATFVRFMNERIQDQSAVIMVTNPQQPQYSDTFFMQYFLFPRFVLICKQESIAECLNSVRARSKAVVHTQTVADPGGWAEAGKYAPFNERMGLWTFGE